MNSTKESGDHYEQNSCLNFILIRLRGTVMRRIWKQILFMSAYSTLIVFLHKYIEGLELNFPVSLMSIMGGVTGLLLVFRTNTAYDRYWEGRKLWSSMTNHCRQLTLGIWVGLDPRHTKVAEKITPETETIDLIERVSALNLMMAFVCATKNYLRGEYSHEEEDMIDLVGHLSKFRERNKSQDLDSKSGTFFEKCKVSSLNRSGKTTEESMNILMDVVNGMKPRDGKGHVKVHKGHGMKAYDVVTPCNIPLEVIYNLYSYLQEVAGKGNADANVLRNLQTSVLFLVTCLTEFERILRTPMPMAYSLHLFYTVYIFLLAIPFQFVGSLNWWTIPVLTLASFALLGILEIGAEIENPFGYDANDLPLDDYCKVIRREVEMITGHPMSHSNVWTMSPQNNPIAPSCWLNASELSGQPLDDVKQLLARRADLHLNKL